MEDESNTSNSNSNSEPQAAAAPRKISLMVPSLFIKSFSSKKDKQPSSPSQQENSENGNNESEAKKVSRPMPASMRKEVEEEQQSEDGDGNKSDDPPSPSPAIPDNSNDEINNDLCNTEESSNRSRSSSPKRKGRPMPASARKKLVGPKSRVKSSHPAENGEEESTTEDPKEIQENGQEEEEEVTTNENDTTETPENGESEDAADHTPSKKSVSRARPMPGSARRKLNHESSSKSNEESESLEASYTDADLKKGSPKKTKRPGPASVRRKFKDSNNSKPDEDEAQSELENRKDFDKDEDVDVSKEPSSPTPEPAKEKSDKEEWDRSSDVEEENLDLDKIEADETSEPVKKPMPASARKKLETTKDDDDASDLANTSDNNINKADSPRHRSSPKKSKNKKPMPASLRFIPASAEEKSEPGRDMTEDSNERSSLTSEKSNSVDNSEEVKKVDISLGGIKFPKFKKPMPASVQKKLEKKQKEKQNDENEEMDIEDSSDSRDIQDGKEESGSTRRGRSSVSNKELKSLYDETFRCQYCDFETYSAYKKNKHEEGHFKIKEEKAPSETANQKIQKTKTKKVTKKEAKYNGSCPICSKRIKNRQKLARHVQSCRFRCNICSKQFKKAEEFHNHNKYFHPAPSAPADQNESLNTSQEQEQDDDANVDHGSRNSFVESKPSVRSKRDDGKASTEDQPEAPRSKKVNSYKRKIADVLSNIGSKTQKKRKHSSDEDSVDGEKDEAPPKKKIVMSESGQEKNESIQGLAMPASVRKKLEERDKDDQKTTENDPQDSDNELHDLECEVCHRVFTLLSNRQRHEKSVHFVKNPRGLSAATDKPDTAETETPKSNESSKEASSSGKTKDKPNKPLTVEDFPKKGKCPICCKFIAKDLRRHAHDVHKIPLGSSIANGNSSVPAAGRPSAPKSYKIYKSATDKVKKKLGSLPISPAEEPSNIVKTENKSSEEEEEKEEETEEIAKTKTTTKAQKETTSASKVDDKELDTSSGPAAPTEIKCGCCDEIFTVKIDFNEHMTKRHSKMKRLIACKLCMHMFTHEDDFILHVQFKHKDLVSGMVKQDQPSPKTSQKVSGTSIPPQSSSSTKSSNHTSKQMKPLAQSVMTTSRRSSRAAGSDQHDFNTAAAESCPRVTVDISEKEKLAADDALKHFNRKSDTSKSKKKGSTKLRSPSPASDGEPMDTYYDDGPSSPAGMGASSPMDVEESGVAAKRRSSRKTTSKKEDDVNKMPCSSCSEVFYSFEALRKHELYFHNMKTSKMCPICGVYPSKLSRHLLAHEYKTVKCSCAPCRLNFSNFGLLLKHNLKHHPGPDGGTKIATEENDTANVESSSNQTDELFRCTLCQKEISGGTHARRHVRRFHHENDDPEKHLEKVGEQEVEGMDISNTDDTNNFDPDWDDDEDDPPARPEPTSGGKSKISKVDSKKPKRAMPASILAKLESELESDIAKLKDKKQETKETTPTPEKKADPPKPVKRTMMPASMREKLAKKEAGEKQTSSTTMAKPKMMPASMRAKLMAKKAPGSVISDTSKISAGSSDKTKPKKLMGPASMRSKLMAQKQRGPASIVSAVSKASESSPSKSKKLMGPASLRSKLMAQQHASDTSSQDMPKPKRPMGPASIRSKLMAQPNKSSPSVVSDTSSQDQSKPKRPMGPASMRAKLVNKVEVKEVAPVYSPPPSPEPNYYDDSNARSRKNGKIERGRNASARSQQAVNDDENDLAVVAVIEDSVPVVAGGSSLFNVADEIAEHNKVVIVGGGVTTSRSTNLSCTYKCKLCEKTFDSDDGIRSHIELEHEEYGPDHTENLIETIYKETVSEVSRRRRSNVNYNKSYRLDEDDEQEVIVSRGSSTRPRGSAAAVDPIFSPYTDSAFSPAISHSVEKTDTNLMYACKFCGKRMANQGSVRRHITKAHSAMKGLYEDEVVLLEPGREHEFVPMLQNENEGTSQQIIPPVVTAPAPEVTTSQVEVETHNDNQPEPSTDLPPPAAALAYKCKICEKSMEKRMNVLIHIQRSHPEVKASAGGNVKQFVEEVYEKENDDSLVNNVITDMESPAVETDNETYTCGLCSFQTTDEPDYVRHYKNHTGASPYQCQYCSATFNRQQHLTAHMNREHTGAEFLNEDETEISMEEMVGVGEISVSTASRIHIDHPKVITLNRTFTSENTTPPGPSSGNSGHADMEEPSEDNITPDPLATTPNTSPKKPKRPMPASVRAKLGLNPVDSAAPDPNQQDSNADGDEANGGNMDAASSQDIGNGDDGAVSNHDENATEEAPVSLNIDATSEDHPAPVPTDSAKSSPSKKSKRPMPASMRAKLGLPPVDQDVATGDNDAASNRDGGNDNAAEESETTKLSPSKLPNQGDLSSLFQSLGHSSVPDSLDNIDDTSEDHPVAKSTPSKSKVDSPKKSKRPMPASMRAKLGLPPVDQDVGTKDGDSASNREEPQDTELSPTKVPYQGDLSSLFQSLGHSSVPDSLVIDDTSEDHPVAKSSPSKSKVDSPKKSKRPMPASMRAKLGLPPVDKDVGTGDDDAASNREEEEPQDTELSPTKRPYQGDLSSLFQTLGHSSVPDSLDIDDDTTEDHPAPTPVPKSKTSKNDSKKPKKPMPASMSTRAKLRSRPSDKNQDDARNRNGKDIAAEDPEDSDLFPMNLPYQGDLSALFPTLGGPKKTPAATGLNIDGGMDLD